MDFNSQKNPSNSSSSSPSKLVLYSFWQSSCSWRVRFGLNVKGLSYEYKSVNLAQGEQFSPEFERLNPLRLVPVLVDGDLVVSDSYAILLYLEEKYPEKALLPLDPQLKAVNLQAASIVTSSIQPLHMLSVLKYIEEKIGPEERLSWAQYNIEKGFLALEKLLKDFAGTYATGEEVYMADVFLAPQIAVAIARFNIDMSKFLTLSRIYESYKALPEFQASLPERQPDAGRLENMSSSQPRGKRGKSFSMQEDETLCKAWLTIKQDSVIGGAQRDSCFWNRVSQHFLKNKVGAEPRTVCSIQNRWEKIRLYCAKYRGCLAQIEHRQQSGYVIADWDDQAKGMYLSDIGKPFIYEHCWELLKGSDKWLIVGVPRNRSPQSPVFEGTSVTPISLNLDQDPISHGSVSSPRGKSKRPSGQKAEKEARQKSKASPQESGLLSETIEKISDCHELGKALFEEQKIQIMKEASEMEATKLQLMRAVEERKKAAEDREQMSQDDAIMNLDTSNMSSELQHYYQLRKNAIMAKALNF